MTQQPDTKKRGRDGENDEDVQSSAAKRVKSSEVLYVPTLITFLDSDVDATEVHLILHSSRQYRDEFFAWINVPEGPRRQKVIGFLQEIAAHGRSTTPLTELLETVMTTPDVYIGKKAKPHFDILMQHPNREKIIGKWLYQSKLAAYMRLPQDLNIGDYKVDLAQLQVYYLTVDLH